MAAAGGQREPLPKWRELQVWTAVGMDISGSLVSIEASDIPEALDGPVRLNPFALAIRPPLTPVEFMDEVARTPRCLPSERTQSAQARQALVLRLDDFVEPLPRFFDLESRISSMIRAGYARRNPIPIARQRELALAQGLDPHQYLTPKPITLASGLSLIGFSGVGKTTAVLSVLSLHDQIHTHSHFMGAPFLATQLVWMRVACPPTGGPRALLMNIFQELDRLLGTDNHRRYENSRRTAAELIPNLVELMSTLGLGILVIDEIQRLVRMGTQEAELLLDVFTHLRTESHTPVMLVGTPKAMRVLNSKFEQGRRNTSLGHIDWHPMDNDDTWTYFVEQMWPLQWLSRPTPLTEELKDALYDWSQGITDLAVKIFKMAQFSVIGSDSEELTPELIKAVTLTEFAWFVPWIPYLKARSPGLMSGELDEPFEYKETSRRPSSAAPDLAQALIHTGINPEDLPRALSAIAQLRTSEAASKKPVQEKKKVKGKKSVGEKSLPADLSLWDLVQQQPHLSGYDALHQAGHVRLLESVGV